MKMRRDWEVCLLSSLLMLERLFEGNSVYRKREADMYLLLYEINFILMIVITITYLLEVTLKEQN